MSQKHNPTNPTAVLAKSVAFGADKMDVTLTDERHIIVPLSWFPFLSDACRAQRNQVNIENGGTWLFWPELDDRISVAGLVAGAKNTDKEKALEATVSYAQSLSQWALLTIAGTALLLVSTEYRRPTDGRLLYTYFLFIPGWISLIFSMYKGVRVQQAYLGYLFSDKANWVQSVHAVNSDALWQVRGMHAGIVLFGVWLMAHLFYWILFYQPVK